LFFAFKTHFFGKKISCFLRLRPETHQLAGRKM
jgi:hypothetical protein